MTATIASLAGDLLRAHAPHHALWLDIGEVAVQLRTNSAALRDVLASYFAEAVAAAIYGGLLAELDVRAALEP